MGDILECLLNHSSHAILVYARRRLSLSGGGILLAIVLSYLFVFRGFAPPQAFLTLDAILRFLATLSRRFITA